MSVTEVYFALCLLWFASESWYGRRRSSGNAATSRDAGTLVLLHVIIYASIALAVWLSTTGLARFPAGARLPTLWIGMVMMVAGIALRWWSIRVLSRWFTVDVAIHPDQQLVRAGPYCLLRHSSYTGALLTFYGFALGLGNWLSLLLVVVLVTLGFLWRIRVEERVLSEAFPVDYPVYARTTKRLAPHIW